MNICAVKADERQSTTILKGLDVQCNFVVLLSQCLKWKRIKGDNMHWRSVCNFNLPFIPTHQHQKSRYLANLLCSSFISLLVLLPVGFANASNTLQLAHVGGPDGAIGRGGDRFAENLEKVSGGALTVKIIPDGALGGIRDIWAQMQAGSVDMQVIDLMAISLLKAGKPLQVVILPYMFESQDHFRKFTESDLLTNMLVDITEETGIRYLGIVEDRSPRIISTTGKVVNTVEDVAGLKIRVPGHPMFIKVFKSWGAVPTPISLSEARWNQFSEQEKSWVREAMEISERDSKIVFEQRMQEAEEKLKKMGIAIQSADIDSFKSATETFHEQFEDIWPAGTVEQIKALTN